MAKPETETTQEDSTETNETDDTSITSASEILSLYQQAKLELNQRITHTELGFDVFDRLYRSHIDKNKWPFNSRVFTPVAFSALLRKDTRLIASKMAGRLTPTEDGQELGAMIGTELLHSQWDDVDFADDEPMLMRWFRVSQNARKYGAGFAYVPWRKTSNFDGPDFIPWDNRDVLTIPGSLNINDGVMLRSYPTIESLYAMNDRSTSGPLFDPAVLAQLEANPGNNDSETTVSFNRTFRGFSSMQTDANEGLKSRLRRVTMVKFLRPDRWVTFFPDSGDNDGLLIGQDIANPYAHGEVPVLRLVYYPIDDDIYGVSELEPIRSQLKGLNALVCNYLDSVNLELFPILKGHPTNVQYSTVDYHARAVWLMNNPQTDLVKLETSNTGLQKFTEIYKMLVGAMAEALGESTAEASSAAPIQGDKTATEIRDTALLRSARDNFNKLALSQAMAKMVVLWWRMNTQFMTDNKLVRVAGKEAIEFFIKEGLSGWKLSDAGYAFIETYMEQNPQIEFDQAYEILRTGGKLEQYAEPIYPAGTTLPKLKLDRSGKSGFLTVDPKGDLQGSFHYVPDIEAMSLPNDSLDAANLSNWFNDIVSVQQQLSASGDAPRYKDILVKIASKLKVSDAEQYFGSGDGMAPAPSPAQAQLPVGSPPAPPLGGAPAPMPGAMGPGQLPTGDLGAGMMQPAPSPVGGMAHG